MDANDLATIEEVVREGYLSNKEQARCVSFRYFLALMEEFGYSFPLVLMYIC